jgi:hypothetical protein
MSGPLIAGAGYALALYRMPTFPAYWHARPETAITPYSIIEF